MFHLIGFGAASLAVIIFGWLGLRAWKVQRLITNLPTSKVEGITLGLTELSGACRHGRWSLEGPFSELTCVIYRYRVSEYQRKTRIVRDSKGRTRTETYYTWVTILQGARRVPFLLEDDTGSVYVVPEEAEWRGFVRYQEIHYPGDPRYEWTYSQRRGQGRKRRLTEWNIAEGDPLYVLAAAVPDEETGLPYVGKDEVSGRFLITVQPESKVRATYFWTALLWNLLALAILFGSVGVAGNLMWDRKGELISVRALILASTAVILFSLVVWVLLLFNDMVWLRTQIRKAFSNVDVALKKRADLVVNLVRIVEGYVSHERETLEEVVEARTMVPEGGGAEALGEAADAQTRQLGRLYALVEDYPRLKADSMFQELMRELTALENRIALLRAFYNETILNYHNRIETFPSVLVARLFVFERQTGFEIEEFEAKPIRVEFYEPAAVAAAGEGLGSGL